MTEFIPNALASLRANQMARSLGIAGSKLRSMATTSGMAERASSTLTALWVSLRPMALAVS
ncbi:MAG: hypothetical protein A4E60_03573 [Syntrophorhabdus sp. PtaB.Bin047]|nr:MAG: hypothetical protein A4E60_03573 [Syntrophorhabdus sp. PtaB.Bin047]